MPTSVRSHTKINLGLAIGPLRPDGFHQLTTVYQTLALHEWVTVEARSGSRNAHHAQQHSSTRAHRCRQYRVADGGTLPRVARSAGRGPYPHRQTIAGTRRPGRRLGQRRRRAHRVGARTRSPALAAGTPAPGGRDRFRCPAVSARRRGGRGRTRGGSLPSTRYSVAALRARAARQSGFPRRKPTATGTACRPRPR